MRIDMQKADHVLDDSANQVLIGAMLTNGLVMMLLVCVSVDKLFSTGIRAQINTDPKRV